MDLPRWLPPRLPAAPPALPRAWDRLAEWWWSLAPRLRVAAITVVVTTAVVVAGSAAVRSPWGPPVGALVAAHDLDAGADLAAGATTWAERPAGLVPPDALTEPAGRLRGAVVAGTVLTRRHVVTDLTALLAADEVAVPVPAEAAPEVPAGARVDVLATATDGTGRHLADGARVLAAEEAWLWVAVPEEVAADVASAAAGRRLSLALRAPGAATARR